MNCDKFDSIQSLDTSEKVAGSVQNLMTFKRTGIKNMETHRRAQTIVENEISKLKHKHSKSGILNKDYKMLTNSDSIYQGKASPTSRYKLEVIGDGRETGKGWRIVRRRIKDIIEIGK
jgi:hypothetical protein